MVRAWVLPRVKRKRGVAIDLPIPSPRWLLCLSQRHPGLTQSPAEAQWEPWKLPTFSWWFPAHPGSHGLTPTTAGPSHQGRWVASRLLPASLAWGRGFPEPGLSPREGELPGVRQRGLGAGQLAGGHGEGVRRGLMGLSAGFPLRRPLWSSGSIWQFSERKTEAPRGAETP